MTKARKKLGETPRNNRSQTWDDRGFGTPVIYLRTERALVSPPVPSRSTMVAVEKEPCPNPRCNAFVIRGKSQPAQCKVCREPFTICPACPTGLVVPKPGWDCGNPDCTYVFGGPLTYALEPGEGSAWTVPVPDRGQG